MNGSPLYQIGAEHVTGLAAFVGVGVLLWLLRARGARDLATADQLLVVLLAGSSAVHAGLLFGHDHGGGVRALFLIDAILLAAVAARVQRGARAGRLGVAVLVGSIVAYWASSLSGEPPDQAGMITKLAEILALAIVLRPSVGSMPRALPSVARGAAIALLVVGTAASSWIGAFRASAAEPSAVAGHNVHGSSDGGGHHSHSGVPAPGVLLPARVDRDATPAEVAAATDLVVTARKALAKYADPMVAAADGYRVAGLAGIDFHAPNPGYESDGRVLDPARPETLVYAVAPDGQPVLMGAMFLMPKIREPGPTIGGPLTVWHAHEHVCISLFPPALAGLLDPLGACPLGTIDVPRTSEMIHIWIVPGAPDAFGDLDDAWKRAYLRSVVTRP